jgi:hypothetical protein
MLQRQVSHPSRRFRLVVETDDPALVISDFTCFRDAGFDVVVCHGPAPEHPCPAVDGDPCTAIAQADVVFNALRDPETQRDVAEAVHRAGGPPMVVSVAPGVDEELPEGCVALTKSDSVTAQTDAVRRAALSTTNDDSGR